MQIAQENETCPAADGRRDLGRLNHEFCFKFSGQSLYLCSQIIRDVEKWPVGRVLDQDLIARIEQRGQGQVIGHRSARRRDYTFLGHAAVTRDTLLERLITVSTRSGDLEFLRVDREFPDRYAR